MAFRTAALEGIATVEGIAVDVVLSVAADDAVFTDSELPAEGDNVENADGVCVVTHKQSTKPITAARACLR